MANSTGKPFAQQLAERTQPYLEEVVVKTIDSAKEMLDTYFDEVAVDRNRDLDNINNKLEDYSKDFKAVNEKISYLISSESRWNADIVKRVSESKSESSKKGVNGAEVSPEVTERSVISKIGEESRPFEAGKISVIQIVSDIRGRLDKVQEDNKEDSKEIVDNFVKPVKEYGKANQESFNSLSKEISSIKKGLSKTFLEKILKGIGLLFIGIAFKDVLKKTVLDPIKDLISMALFPNFKEKQEEKQTQELYQDKWDTSKLLPSSKMSELESKVLEVPRDKVDEALVAMDYNKPSRGDFKRRRDYKEALESWETQKEMLQGVKQDWYRYHPDELQYDIPSTATRGDWWALTSPTASVLHRPDKPYFAESDDPNFTQLAGSSKGFFYTEFAKTPQAQEIRERHMGDISSDPNNPFQGTMFNPSFQREFKQAFEEFIKPYLDKVGGNMGQAVEYYTTVVDNNKNSVSIL